MSLYGFIQLGISTAIFLVAATVAKSWALAPSLGKLLFTLLLYSAGNLIMLRLVREFGMSSAFSLSAIIQLTVPDGWANFHLPWAAMALALFTFGGGRLALDTLIFGRH